ncbi:GrpB family protein [Streptomyces sp. NPDC102462]|uniref:GrpB family protein n=1 Tax=Streptomyces sp. NPDC102462 TaxID=3366178 RepID=UPI0038231965
MADVDEQVHVVAHDPAWAGAGRDLVRAVSTALRGLPVDVAHIGSTAVPGLDAKPIIDVQVGCPGGETRLAVSRIEALGFEHLGQAGVPGREYLRRRSGRLANVHVVARGGRLWTDNLLFRDYLSSHPAAADRYAEAKREAADRAPSLLAYSALKARAVEQIMDAARRAGGPRRHSSGDAPASAAGGDSGEPA